MEKKRTKGDEPINQTFHSDGSVMNESSYNPEFGQFIGLTKREHFAGLALRGLLGSIDWSVERASDEHAHATSVWATTYADALIAQLNKEGGE